MAFWKLYGKSWFIRPFPNMIRMYKEILYDKWWNSLTEEERNIITAKRKRNHDDHINALNYAFRMINYWSNRIDPEGRYL